MTDHLTWKHIDSYPHPCGIIDACYGKHVLLYDGNRVFIGCAYYNLFHDGVPVGTPVFAAWFNQEQWQVHPTHWLPMPELPEYPKE